MHNAILIDNSTLANELVVLTNTNVVNQSDRETSCKILFLFNSVLESGLQRGLLCFGFLVSIISFFFMHSNLLMINQEIICNRELVIKIYILQWLSNSHFSTFSIPLQAERAT